MDILTVTAPQPAQLPFGLFVRRLQVTVTAWFQRARQRRQLAALSARQLDDIGITREQAASEAAKPFWRE